MKNNQLIEHLKNIYETNQSILEMADKKSSVILGISGIIISIILSSNINDIPFPRRTFIGIGVIFALLSSIIQFSVIFPVISNCGTDNIIFYNGIIKNSLKEYKQKIIRLTDEYIINQYSENIYNIALIEKRKYFFLKIGFLLLLISILFISVGFFI